MLCCQVKYARQIICKIQIFVKKMFITDCYYCFYALLEGTLGLAEIGDTTCLLAGTMAGSA